MTESRLERIAFRYLERFATSRENLRKVLERRIRNNNEDFAQPSREQKRWVEDLLKKCERLQLIDDALYAESKARSMARRGKPQRAIAQWLKTKGLSEDHINKALHTLHEEAGDPHIVDIQAALAYARRRRFGPWRRTTLNAERHKKELSAFARAGFPFAIAQQIIEAEDIQAAEALAETDDSVLRLEDPDF